MLETHPKTRDAMRQALTLALLVAAAPAGASPELDPGAAYGSLVLQVHADSTGELGVPFQGPVRLGRDWSLLADGTVSLVFSLNQRVSRGPTGVTAEIKTAVPAHVGALLQALARGEVGRARGACDLHEPLETPHRVEVTWFGRRGRVHRFAIGNQFEVACPPQLVELMNAIAHFEALEIIPELPIGPDSKDGS
jgi:hypothetical protein